LTAPRERHAAHRHRHSLLRAKLQESALVVLQAISRTLDLDQPVAPLVRPELHQIRKAGAVLHDVPHDPLEPPPQIRCRKARERQLQQRCTQQPPGDERRLNAGLLDEPPSNDLLVMPRLEGREALGETIAPPLVKIAAREVGGTVLEIVEKGARYRRKDRVPAEKAEQGVDEPVLDIVNTRVRPVLQMIADAHFHGGLLRQLLEHYMEARDSHRRRLLGGKAEPSTQTRQQPEHMLPLCLVLRIRSRRQAQIMGRSPLPQALEQKRATHPRPPMPAGRQHRQRCGNVGALVGSGDFEQQPLPKVFQPITVRDRQRNGSQDLLERHAFIKIPPAAIQLMEYLDLRPGSKSRRMSGDALVRSDPEIRQHELAPVLPKVAEEHQPEPLGEGFHQRMKNAIRRMSAPPVKRPRIGALFAQHGQQLHLLQPV